MDLRKDEDEALDTFYLGRILIRQKKKGYRFSVDAPLLADFIQTKRSDGLLELGTGNGVISLLLSIKPFKHITALEIQESLASLARKNIRLNHLEDKISVVQENLRTFHSERKFDVIFSNPPYIKQHGGHLSPSEEKSIAKHELKCDIFDVLQKTSELLKKEGRAYFIFPEKRRGDFKEAVKKSGLRIRLLRFVCPRKDRAPNLFMTECDFFSKKTLQIRPLFLLDEDGNYTAEAQAIFSGRIGGEGGNRDAVISERGNKECKSRVSKR